MTSNFKLLLILTTFGMQSCIPRPLELEIEPLPPKLVLHGSLMPDHSLMVQLSTTYAATEGEPGGGETEESFDPTDLAVVHARLVLYAPGDTLAFKHLENGIYRTEPLDLFENLPYTITAYDSVTGEEVSATAYFEPKANVRNISYEVRFEDSDTLIDLRISYMDDPAERNYYLLSAIKVSREDLAEADSLSTFEGREFQSVAFSDEKQSDALTFNTLTLDRFALGDTLLLSVSGIPKDYHDYLKLRDKAQNWYSELTREAVSFPSNVRNGYGFFHMMNPVLDVIPGLKADGGSGFKGVEHP